MSTTKLFAQFTHVLDYNLFIDELVKVGNHQCISRSKSGTIIIYPSNTELIKAIGKFYCEGTTIDGNVIVCITNELTIKIYEA